MSIYVTLYFLIGAIVCFATRKKLFLPLSEETEYPIIMFVVIVVFWVPMIVLALFLIGRDRIQVKSQKKEINVHALDRNLENDARFHFVHSIQGRMYIQHRGSCIACRGSEGLLSKTEIFGKKSNPYLQVKLQVCTSCVTQGITGIDILEEEYKEEEHENN
ncbi:hypothetical protein P4493_06190 [Bacillus thuringiensis]|jgi:hypothetical protein|uniref:Uncharacterized protein n=3 Tax=Bacillus thuringiensis TaxID=1428 RepID=A0A0B5NLI1_BACTU|nr:MULTISPECIES: hypothetical protein [Bacillus]EAO56532.1 hypothetical protein RBTH_05467 [Bacillus thuringiensis serovar israelensis ATCC 35646]MEC2533153.1 hypothetical protein [Bacillus cereus]MED1153866.1 hypothetical protein [Bacillus paranthracis]OUB09283.1 hypothetical protein BK708_32660 [Bacillus thuringiensis serovar yunnanensis]AFQ30175.1 hypothetical protein BTF1_30372 [Bacillus thuringiensis HD-789]